jgi:aspartate racemase
MKTIGIIGGMSWESSAEYYRLINEAVARRLGGFHSARTVMLSVDFAEVERLQEAGDWEAAGARLAEAAADLERGGAECLVLATNTMHRVAPAIEAATSIPLLHIADATAEAIRMAGLSRVGLLGTRYTMEQDFYRGRLEGQFGLDVVVPGEPDRTTVHEVIYDELVLGTVRDESREAYRAVMARLVERGAQAVILGCTEIGLLVGAADAPVPLFDTTRLHAERAVEWALAD